MIIDRQHLVDYLRAHGRVDTVDRVEAELPEQVDVHAQEALLLSLGVDIDALLDHEPDHLAERTDPHGMHPY
ncbi:MAG TPA: hypothetical protein VFJ97_02400 [Dermatophilaceae bacterium]|nr:hypothetical protein [Dermatophilaceae bacterium]